MQLSNYLVFSFGQTHKVLVDVRLWHKITPHKGWVTLAEITSCKCKITLYSALAKLTKCKGWASYVRHWHKNTPHVGWVSLAETATQKYWVKYSLGCNHKKQGSSPFTFNAQSTRKVYQGQTHFTAFQVKVWFTVQDKSCNAWRMEREKIKLNEPGSEKGKIPVNRWSTQSYIVWPTKCWKEEASDSPGSSAELGDLNFCIHGPSLQN